VGTSCFSSSSSKSCAKFIGLGVGVGGSNCCCGDCGNPSTPVGDDSIVV